MDVGARNAVVQMGKGAALKKENLALGKGYRTGRLGK